MTGFAQGRKGRRMSRKIFTFWEGKKPAYIELCMQTWKFPYVVLNYKNLNEYTDLKADANLKRFTLPQIADAVRVHVLRDQGGYWLDADTIMITGKLPEETLIGNPDKRECNIGYLYAEKPHMEFFEEWARYQDAVIDNMASGYYWGVMGNDFTDPYIRKHSEVTIAPVRACFPETYMIGGDAPRPRKYQQFYFERNYHLADIAPTDMLMLHNSWTPAWYKALGKTDLLTKDCTLSNILKETQP